MVSLMLLNPWPKKSLCIIVILTIWMFYPFFLPCNGLLVNHWNHDFISCMLWRLWFLQHWSLRCIIVILIIWMLDLFHFMSTLRWFKFIFSWGALVAIYPFSFLLHYVVTWYVVTIGSVVIEFGFSGSSFKDWNWSSWCFKRECCHI